jgi:hypothetical protein
LLGLYTEFGPWRVGAQNKLLRNPFAWTTLASIVFLEQPVGVGFSYSTTPVAAQGGELRTGAVGTICLALKQACVCVWVCVFTMVAVTNIPLLLLKRGFVFISFSMAVSIFTSAAMSYCSILLVALLLTLLTIKRVQ